ncbi:hypothetical protein THAOC_27790 [Thalassiosira oceanica]|uniref:Uncharacterized protein n=1 Tax=Thalassiosira oceanica TaxID=159749 RepID=K0RI09_THAOC|nr:hypothetical protein THAOC_27790 [Thalassiosira oceanica]|eukprot:EJK52885.1 hypothetical protein THAOC_27790 [Thalassiosira oceanica]
MGISCTGTDPARWFSSIARCLLHRQHESPTCSSPSPEVAASASASDPAVFPATRRRFRVGMAAGRHGGDVRGLLNWASQQSSSSLSPAVLAASGRPSSHVLHPIPGIPGPAGPALLPVDMTWSLVLALTSAEKFRPKSGGVADRGAFLPNL